MEECPDTDAGEHTSQQEFRDRYKALFDRSLYCVYIHDFRGRFLDANQAALDLLGYTREDVPTLTFSSLMGPDQLPRAFRLLDEIRRSGSQRKPAEFKLRRKDGTTVWVETEASVVSSDADSLVIQGIARDITEHKRTEESLRASVAEKEVLLREIHHRVKNNLQVISSLLDMKAMRTNDKRMIELCRDARAKIHTMALIHTHIYESKRLTRIAMREYIRDLVNYLSQVYSDRSQHVLPVVERADVHLSITQAIPFAIVVNEAISNAFKHAFKAGERGTIRIALRKTPDNTVRLRIRDNGVGFPRGLDIRHTETLGLKLIRNLVQDQLKGSVQLEQNQGTSLTIEFKAIEEEQESDAQDSGC
jgi:PAS domain S-box-containing protein